MQTEQIEDKSTLVVQSYRPDRTTPWILKCLASVSAWADSCGYAYEFLDDVLFNFAPDWVHKRCAGQKLPITDIARLYLLKDRLKRYQCIIWADADLLIFAPQHLLCNRVKGYALAREVWISHRSNPALSVKEKINNSCIVMERHHPMLDFLIFASEEVLRNQPSCNVTFLSVGTDLLTKLSTVMPVRVLPGAGTFSPLVISEIISGTETAMAQLASGYKTPLGAANLCGSLVGKQLGTIKIDDSDMMRAVEILLTSQGNIVSDRCRANNYSKDIASKGLAL